MIENMENINWDNLRHGDKILVDGRDYKVCVSKGRKMLESFSEQYRTTAIKVLRGFPTKQPKVQGSIHFIMDHGADISADATYFYPSESYVVPNGKKTSNKWDIYESTRKL